MRHNKDHVVCVISPNKNVYSETFIRAHIERLAATVKVLYERWFPTYSEDDEPLVSPDLASRIVRAAGHRLFRLPSQYFQIRDLRVFLRVNKIEAVLAEYGPAGAAVMNSSLMDKKAPHLTLIAFRTVIESCSKQGWRQSEMARYWKRASSRPGHQELRDRFCFPDHDPIGM